MKLEKNQKNEESDETSYAFPEKDEIIINKAHIKGLEEIKIDLLKEVLKMIRNKQDQISSCERFRRGYRGDFSPSLTLK